MKSTLCLSSLVLVLALSPSAKAEDTVFGLNRAQFGETLGCAASATYDYSSFVLYNTHEPLEATLKVALESNSKRAEPRPVADIEQRLRRVYDSKPESGSQWARQSFETCMAPKQIPLPTDRLGICYLQSYFLSSLVAVRKNMGDTEAQILESYTGGGRNKAQQDNVLALISLYYARDTSDKRKTLFDDTNNFFMCTVPDRVRAEQAARKKAEPATP